MIEDKKVDVLAFGAHPDDIEFGCGGILAKLASHGKSMVFVDLTLGERGSNGDPQTRKKEAEAAAQMLGAERIFLDFSDCEIFDTYEGRLVLTRVIRQYRPRLVLAPMWKGEQNHPDHIACGLMARYACRYARFNRILPDLPIHRPEGVLHYIYPNNVDPDFLIDISEYVEDWKQMMACHASQMQTLDYIDLNLRIASRFGVMIGKPYAQGLIKGNAIVVDDLMHVAEGVREI